MLIICYSRSAPTPQRAPFAMAASDSPVADGTDSTAVDNDSEQQQHAVVRNIYDLSLYILGHSTDFCVNLGYCSVRRINFATAVVSEGTSSKKGKKLSGKLQQATEKQLKEKRDKKKAVKSAARLVKSPDTAR